MPRHRLLFYGFEDGALCVAAWPHVLFVVSVNAAVPFSASPKADGWKIADNVLVRAFYFSAPF